MTAHGHDKSTRTYFIVFGALMVLLALTFVAGKINLDRIFTGLNLTVALVIAVIKALLVVLFFMHVRDSTKLTWLFAGAGFAIFMILITLSMSDYTTRPANDAMTHVPTQSDEMHFRNDLSPLTDAARSR